MKEFHILQTRRARSSLHRNMVLELSSSSGIRGWSTDVDRIFNSIHWLRRMDRSFLTSSLLMSSLLYKNGSSSLAAAHWSLMEEVGPRGVAREDETDTLFEC